MYTLLELNFAGNTGKTDNCKLVLLLSLTLRLCYGVDESKFIAGYGVEFVKLQGAVSKWQDADVFPLSDLNYTTERNINIAEICPISEPFDKDLTVCRFYHRSFGAVISNANVTLQEIIRYRTFVTSMTDQTATHRVKRGLFNAIRTGLKKFSGISVEDDDNKLQNEINAIENGLKNYTKGFVSTSDSLYSMEIHINDNIKKWTQIYFTHDKLYCP